MDYRRMNDICYIRIDKGEEIIEKLLEVCTTEGIGSAVFSGIGGCSRAELQTFVPEIGCFETETKSVTVLYIAEIELRPVIGGIITRKHDPETGTGFWNFG